VSSPSTSAEGDSHSTTADAVGDAEGLGVVDGSSVGPGDGEALSDAVGSGDADGSGDAESVTADPERMNSSAAPAALADHCRPGRSLRIACTSWQAHDAWRHRVFQPIGAATACGSR
jgi:hypothetical protein